MRVFTAVWAVWLGAALSKPLAMHPMAMQSAGATAGMQGMRGMDHAPSAELPANQPGETPAEHMPSHGSNGDCSCICNCCCVPPAIAPSRPTTNIDCRVVAPHDAVAINVDTRASVALPPYSLPFANGPPAESTV